MDKQLKVKLTDLEIKLDSLENFYQQARTMTQSENKEVAMMVYAHEMEILKVRVEILKIAAILDI